MNIGDHISCPLVREEGTGIVVGEQSLDCT